jgi:hypothetical protein
MHGNPTLKPIGFNPKNDAEILNNAMKGVGCNKDKIILVLCARTNAQRQEIAKEYKVLFGKDLARELKGELSGDFENLVLALMDTPAEYDAKQLNRAVKGLGTKENVLIEILATRSNGQLNAVKSAYKQLFKKDLEDDIRGDTSGDFQRLLVALSVGARDESYRTDQLKANQDARALYRAGEQRLGTDEETFNRVIASQNFSQLQLVFEEYRQASNTTIEQAIEAEFGKSDTGTALLAIVKCIRNRPAYFAELLYNSLKGLGTRDEDLIRLVVSRSEIDLADIRVEYSRLYKTSLENAIAGDCSGAYKEGLLAIVKGN